MNPHFAAACKLEAENLVLRQALKDMRRDLDRARASRDVWKRRCWDAEWQAGIRRTERKVLA